MFQMCLLFILFSSSLLKYPVPTHCSSSHMHPHISLNSVYLHMHIIIRYTPTILFHHTLIGFYMFTHTNNSQPTTIFSPTCWINEMAKHIKNTIYGIMCRTKWSNTLKTVFTHQTKALKSTKLKKEREKQTYIFTSSSGKLLLFCGVPSGSLTKTGTTRFELITT